MRRAELPGYGLLPAQWVPEAVQRRTMLESVVYAARDADAMARVLQVHSGAVPDTALYLANSQLVRLLLQADAVGATWTAASCEAAHSLALQALQGSHSSLVHMTTVLMLGTLARSDCADVTQQSLLAVLRAVLEVLDRMTTGDDSFLVADEHLKVARLPVFAAVSWIFRAVQYVMEDHQGTQFAADTESLLSSCGAMPLLGRVAAKQLALLDGVPVSDDDLSGPWFNLYRVLQVLHWHADLRDCAPLQCDVAVCKQVVRVALSVADRVAAAPRLQFTGYMLDSAFAVTAWMLAHFRSTPETKEQEAASICALLHASNMPRLVARVAREQPQNPDKLRNFIILWSTMVVLPAAWPGGASALAAVAEEAGVLAVLATARAVILRTFGDLGMRDVALRQAASLEASARALLQARSAEKAKAAGAAQRAQLAARAAAAEAAAAALLAEEEAAAAEVRKKAAVKAKKAERKAAEQRARAEAEAAAAAAAQQAEEERRAAAAAAAAANAAQAAAAQARQRAAAEERQRAAAQAAEAERRRAAQAQRDASEAQRRRQQQQQQPQRRQVAVPVPIPLAPPPAAAAGIHDRHHTPTSAEAQLAELFPWLTMGTPAAAAAPAQPADDGDDGSCVICMDQPRNAALQPCDHGLLCITCAAAVLAATMPACPVCRVTATGLRKL